MEQRFDMVPHTPDGPPPATSGSPGHPPPPPRHDSAVVIYSDSAEVQKLIESLHKHPDFLEWEDDSILVTTIKRLTICNTKLVSVGSFIGNMTFLTNVNIAFNRIVEISSLAMCPNLVSVDISHNKILAIDSVRDLKDLKVLRCHHNHIESLEPIVELTQLEDLWVSHNSLQWTEFIHLLPQVNLRSIVKSNNPGNEKKLMNEFIHAICPDVKFIDGVDIRSQFAHASAREFLRSTDGKIMFSQALIQLPAHTKKIIQESEGEKARLQTEYAGAAEQSPDGRHHAHHSLDPRYEQHDKSGQSQRQAEAAMRRQESGAQSDDQGQGFRRGRKDLLRTNQEGGAGEGKGNGNEKGAGAKLERELDNKEGEGDHLSLRSALIAEASISSNGIEKEKESESHAAGGAGTKKMGLRQKSHLREVKSSGYGQQKGKGPGQKVKHFKARKNDYSTEYGDTGAGRGEQILPRESAESSATNPHQVRGPRAVPKHLIRHGNGSSTDPVALCVYTDGTGYSRYAHNNAYAVSMEASEHTGKQKLLAYYRSGSLAVTLDGDGNGSIMDTKGKCVALLTSQGRGVAKILHPKTGIIMSQYTRPPEHRARHGHEGNAIDYGGEAGSAEAGSDMVLRGSHSNVSLLTDEGNGNGDQGQEQGQEEGQEQEQAQAGPNPEGTRRKHTWKFEGLLISFVPSTWELKVGIDNDRAAAEFSTLTGGKLVKAKGADEAATKTQPQGDGASVDTHVSGASGGSGASRASGATQGSNKSGQSGASQGRRSDRALSRVSQELLGAPAGQKDLGRDPKRYLKSNMTEQDHTVIRENVEEVISNLDSLLGDLNKNKNKNKGKR